jgi:hypothetical protein
MNIVFVSSKPFSLGQMHLKHVTALVLTPTSCMQLVPTLTEAPERIILTLVGPRYRN